MEKSDIPAPTYYESVPVPPYDVAVGASPVVVETRPPIVVQQPIVIQQQVPVNPQPIMTSSYQQPAMTNSYQQQQPAAPQNVVTVNCKKVKYGDSYLEYCPRCQTAVTTRTVYERGVCWWILFGMGFVFFILWIWLCCVQSKDVLHFCPNCGTKLAVKKL